MQGEEVLVRKRVYGLRWEYATAFKNETNDFICPFLYVMIETKEELLEAINSIKANNGFLEFEFLHQIN